MPLHRIVRDSQTKAKALWPAWALKTAAIVGMVPSGLASVVRKLFTRRKFVLEHSSRIFGVVLLCLAIGHSQALTLGRVRGAALVGQPLNMVIQVQMDVGEDAASLCFEADVFHADTRQDPSRVRVQVEPAAQAQMANVRVTSAAIVDEPVVTVYLRTGCGQKTSRRYVLLADMPSEVAASPVLPVAPVPTAPVRVTPVPVDAAASRAESSPAAKVKKSRAPQPAGALKVARQRAEEPVPASASKRVPHEEKSTAVRATGQSRLKLDPLDFLSDRVANLEFPVPITTPEETLRNLQRMQTLEGSMKTLQASAAKSEASVLDLKARLQKAESERFPVGLLYGLISLVLACLGAVAWLWTRQRRVPPGGEHWWVDSVMPAAPAPTAPATVLSPVAAVAPQAQTPSPLAEKASAGTSAELTQDSRLPPAVDVNLMEMSDSFFDDFMQSDPEHSARRKLSPLPVAAARTGQARKLNSEAMLDIRRQAEFFVSLGQADQAARILKRQIRESESPNPFDYLDLLSVLHSLGLKAEFEQFRERCNRLFSGVVPEFAAFTEEGRSLESYPDVLSRLTTLWETPGVLEVIDSYIFRDAPDTGQPAFDLAAFRELLLLHGVAHPVVLLPRVPEGEPAFDSAPADATVGLDLDLSAPEMADFTSHFGSTGHIDLPLLEPEEDAPESRISDAPLPSRESGNLIDFDFPLPLKNPGKPSL